MSNIGLQLTRSVFHFCKHLRRAANVDSEILKNKFLVNKVPKNEKQTLSQTKTAKKKHSLGAAQTYNSHIKVYPSLPPRSAGHGNYWYFMK